MAISGDSKSQGLESFGRGANPPAAASGFPGQIQLVDFQHLRAHLGGDWAHNKARVHDAVTDLLRRELSPWDFSTLVGQENLLIIYGDDNLSAAQRISSKIGEQIEAILGGGYHSLLMDLRPGSTRRKLSKSTRSARRLRAKLQRAAEIGGPGVVSSLPCSPTASIPTRKRQPLRHCSISPLRQGIKTPFRSPSKLLLQPVRCQSEPCDICSQNLKL